MHSLWLSSPSLAVSVRQMYKHDVDYASTQCTKKSLNLTRAHHFHIKYTSRPQYSGPPRPVGAGGALF